MNLYLAANWKTEVIPSKEDWLWEVRYMLLMCKVSALIKYRKGHFATIFQFKKQWVEFYQYYSKVLSRCQLLRLTVIV